MAWRRVIAASGLVAACAFEDQERSSAEADGVLGDRQLPQRDAAPLEFVVAQLAPEPDDLVDLRLALLVDEAAVQGDELGDGVGHPRKIPDRGGGRQRFVPARRVSRRCPG